MNRRLITVLSIFFVALNCIFSQSFTKIREEVECSSSFLVHSTGYELKFERYIQIEDYYILNYTDSHLYQQLGTNKYVLFVKKIGKSDIEFMYAYPFPEINSLLKKQTKYTENIGTTIIADFNYDEANEYLSFSMLDFNCEIQIYKFSNNTSLIESNFCTNTDLFFPKHDTNELIKHFFQDNLYFCIINNKRGFCLTTFYKTENNIKEKKLFFSWSSTEQRYILDETVTDNQLKNAYCPEDYFAYNGLKFSKLDSKLTVGDLQDLDKAQLRLMRNAVYARHGRTFKSVDLQSLWECYTWYKKNPNYSDSLLTDIDKYNIELIQKYEAK